MAGGAVGANATHGRMSDAYFVMRSDHSYVEYSSSIEDTRNGKSCLPYWWKSPIDKKEPEAHQAS